MRRKQLRQSKVRHIPRRVHAVGLLLIAVTVLQATVCLPALAAPGDAEILRGTIENGTSGQLVVDWPVEVWAWQETGPVLVSTAVSDDQGVFEFSGLEVGPERVYRVQTTYEDVLYASETVALSPDLSSLPVRLLVYETTDQADNVVVSRFHFVVLARDPGAVSVLELYQFGNEGSETYVGAVATDGSRQSVSIDLPQDAFGLVLQNDSLAEMVGLTDNRLQTAAPVVPGQATLDLAFSYRLPYSGTQTELAWRPGYRMARVNGLVLDQGLELSSETLTFTGDLEVEGQRFKQYEGGALRVGDTLSLRLSNLPAPEDGVQPVEIVEPVPAGTTSTATGRWLILGVGCVLLMAGVTYPRWSRGGDVQSEVGIGSTAEREQLLHMLAQLDDARAAGLLDEEVYRQLRTEHKVRLASIWPASTE